MRLNDIPELLQSCKAYRDLGLDAVTRLL